MARKPKKQIKHDFVSQWPEVFTDVKLSAIPIYYLHSVVVSFNDGEVWNIVLKKSDRESGEEFTETLNELFENYDSNIENVDFRLDVEKIKKDVMKSTKQFLKRKR